MIPVWSGREVARTDYFTFLNDGKGTSIRLILVLCVHLGDKLVSLVGATYSSFFFSISTYGFI
jgi:hypothetical protein